MTDGDRLAQIAAALNLRDLARAALRRLEPGLLAELAPEAFRRVYGGTPEAVAAGARREIARRRAVAELKAAGPGGAELAQAGETGPA